MQSEILQTGLRHLVSSAKRRTLEVEEDAGRSIRVIHVQQYSTG